MMLHGPDSTVRIEVLGEELRRLREACGLTLSQVVSRIGISESHLSRMEVGKRAPSPEDISALLVIYGVTGVERLEMLALTKKAGQPGLWQRNGSFESRFATLKILESRTTAMVTFEPLIMPGLLQTMPYAQAAVRELGMIDDEDLVNERVVDRLQRQAVLRKVGAPHLVALLTESALRNPVGGRTVLRDQLRYLVEVAGHPNVTLRIVPTVAGGHPGLLGSFLRLRFAERPSVVFLENLTSSLFLEEHRDIAVYDRVIVELLSAAMDEENSVRLVAAMAATLE